jgi:hypothetical protein
MLVYTKFHVAVPSFLFNVRAVTGVIVTFLTFLRLTGFLLAFHISLKHGLREGHVLTAPRLLVGLLGLRGLTCCCLKGLTIAVMGLEGTAVGFATLAELLTATLLRDLTSRAPRRLVLWVTLGFGWGCTALPFALSFLLCFSIMTRSMASRSGSNVGVDSGTVEWLRLYWFCHNIGTDASTMVARSALPKRIFPYFIVGTALGLSFNIGSCLT